MMMTAAGMLPLFALLPLALAAPNVQAPWGTVSGKDNTNTVSGAAYWSYQGIPFAKQPVGELRFAKPEAHPGLADGDVHFGGAGSYLCPQDLEGIPPEFMNEACLTLDIYTPAVANQSGKSVLVYIHGGGFFVGGAGGFSPSQLVTENDVIVVVIQYRLGALGFLASGEAGNPADRVLPGNLGLWDQTLALKWVKDNIQAFGGNPDTITIFGESAGSASVGYQLLAPAAKGLFTRAILQSGTPLEAWSINRHPDQSFKWLAGMTGCLSDDSSMTSRQQLEAELACMKELSVTSFFSDEIRLYSLDFASVFGSSSMSYPWVPVEDGDFVRGDPFDLCESASHLKSVGTTGVDVMIGVNNQESGNMAEMKQLGMVPDVPWARDLLRDEIVFTLPELQGDGEAKRLKAFTDLAQFYYFSPLHGGNASEMAISKAVDDLDYNVGTVRFIRGLARAGQTVTSAQRGELFLFLFNHFPARKAGQEMAGTFHADDVAYLWDEGDFASRANFTAEDLALGTAFRKLHAQFAKTGNPGVVVNQQSGASWPTYTLGDESYLSFAPTPSVEKGLFARQVELWASVLPSMARDTRADARPAPGDATSAAQAPQVPSLLDLLFAAVALLMSYLS